MSARGAVSKSYKKRREVSPRQSSDFDAGVLPRPFRPHRFPYPRKPAPRRYPPPGLGLLTRPPSASSIQRPHRLSGDRSPSARGKRYMSRASPPPLADPSPRQGGRGAGQRVGGEAIHRPVSHSSCAAAAQILAQIFAQGEAPKPPLGGHLLVLVFQGGPRPRENRPGVGGRGNPPVQQ